MGAHSMGGLVGDVAIPWQIDSGTAYWLAETAPACLRLENGTQHAAFDAERCTIGCR